MATKQDPPAQQDTLAGLLTAAMSAVSGIGAALGTASGALNHAARDQPVMLAIGLALVIAAVLLSVFTLQGIWPDSLSSTLRKYVLIVSPAVLALGIAVCIGTLLWVVSHPPQQLAISGGVVVTANAETLNVTIKGGGFSTSDRVHVRVQASGASTPWMYESTIGVDPTGAVDDPITLALPHGTYRHVQVFAWVGEPADKSATKCEDFGNRASCADFEVKPEFGHPQLVASWAGTGSGQTVTATIAATSLGQDQAVAVMVIGTPKPPPAAPPPRDPILYTTLLRPDEQGSVKTAISIPVGTGYQNVCVLAQLTAGTSWPIAADTKCPPELTPELVWAVLITP